MKQLPVATWWNRLKLCWKIMWTARMTLDDFHVIVDMLPEKSEPQARVAHETNKWALIQTQFKVFKGPIGRKVKNRGGATL